MTVEECKKAMKDAEDRLERLRRALEGVQSAYDWAHDEYYDYKALYEEALERDGI